MGKAKCGSETVLELSGRHSGNPRFAPDLVRKRQQGRLEKLHQNQRHKAKKNQESQDLFYRTHISEATESPQEIWQLAKWARFKNQAFRKIPKMVPLSYNGRTAEDFEKKTNMLKSFFFRLSHKLILKTCRGLCTRNFLSAPLLLRSRKYWTPFIVPKLMRRQALTEISNKIL